MNRNYNSADTDMFSTSDTHRLHFITYKADFITLDPDFNDPFETDWLASIDASEGYETAETRDDQLQQESEEVDAAMLASRECYIGMKYYIEKAFADKPKIRQKFGLDDYDEASRSHKKMRGFLLNLHTQSVVPAHLASLTTAGCTAGRLANILVIQATLRTEDREQNAFAATETIATKGRITQYNATYAFDQKVNRASKVIFYNNPEVLNLFLFPRHSEPAELFNVLGTVRDSASAPLSAVQVRIYVSAASPIAVTTTDSNGEYGFAAILPGNYTLEFSKAGFTTQTLPVTVAASGQVTVDATLV
jgi:hypothetical protein